MCVVLFFFKSFYSYFLSVVQVYNFTDKCTTQAYLYFSTEWIFSKQQHFHLVIFKILSISEHAVIKDDNMGHVLIQAIFRHSYQRNVILGDKSLNYMMVDHFILCFLSDLIISTIEAQLFLYLMETPQPYLQQTLQQVHNNFAKYFILKKFSLNLHQHSTANKDEKLKSLVIREQWVPYPENFWKAKEPRTI